MEVEVELDRPAGAVVFRSTRSTLYGNVGKPGEEGGGMCLGILCLLLYRAHRLTKRTYWGVWRDN